MPLYQLKMETNMSVHVIAEAGSNYNGSVDLAFKLNRVALDAGADSVKYQIIYSEGLYRTGIYAYGHYDIKDVLRIRKEGELTDNEWLAVCTNARDIGISFSASVFDTRGLDLLMSFDPPYIKTASSDLNNLRFLREVAVRGKPMVVSTGMATLIEIERTVNELIKHGVSSEKLVLLHCVSSYPTELGDTNLAFLQILKQFGTTIGFSDHTLSSEAACLAVALGATWIEKHFTTDHTLDGFDHKHAIEPLPFGDYIKAIRATENSLLPKHRKIGDAEAYTKQRARRGLYVASDLPAGHILANNDILIVRPENTISADQVDQVVGMQLIEPLKANEPLSFQVLNPVITK
jgi:N,N'-diacetyllegionaminate synthase